MVQVLGRPRKVEGALLFWSLFVSDIECEVCGEVYSAQIIRCPSCGAVTKREGDTSGEGTCKACRLFAGVSFALLLFWIYVFLTQTP